MENYSKCKVCSSNINLINKTYQLVKCTNCDLVFSEIIFSDAEIIETYDRLYNKSNQYERHIDEFQKLKNKIKINLGKDKRKILKYILNKKVQNVCEIGSGVGIVADYLNNKTNYVGIELDKSTAEKAQSLGFNVINDSFTHLDKFVGDFEAVLAFEVIEHIQDLDLFFQLSKKALSSRGYLGFTVPNYDKIKNYQNVGDRLCQDIPPIHVNFFTVENLSKILDFHGFEIKILKARKYPYFNINKIDTYKFFFKSFFGSFHGQTILCVAQKKE